MLLIQMAATNDFYKIPCSDMYNVHGTIDVM